MRWFSLFIGHRDSDGLLDNAFSELWIHSEWEGANLDDEFAMFCAGGEPWPHD